MEMKLFFINITLTTATARVLISP